MLVNPELIAAQTQVCIPLNFLKILVFCRNDGLLVENYGLGTHSDKIYADKYFNWKYLKYPTIYWAHLSKSAKIASTLV